MPLQKEDIMTMDFFADTIKSKKYKKKRLEELLIQGCYLAYLTIISVELETNPDFCTDAAKEHLIAEFIKLSEQFEAAIALMQETET